MDVWEILGIQRTKDKRAIKRAYARAVAKYHPEEYPEEFQEIYAAYEEAMSYAQGDSFADETRFTEDAVSFLQGTRGERHAQDLQDVSVKNSRKGRKESEKNSWERQGETGEPWRDSREESEKSPWERREETEKNWEGSREESEKSPWKGQGETGETRWESREESEKSPWERHVEAEKHPGQEWNAAQEDVWDRKESFAEQMPVRERRESHTPFDTMDWMEEDFSFDSLLERMRELLYGTRWNRAKDWDVLLHTAEFQRALEEERFWHRFTTMYREALVSRRVARRLFVAFDFYAAEKRFEPEVYRELKDLITMDLKGKGHPVQSNEDAGRFPIFLKIGSYILLFLLSAFLKMNRFEYFSDRQEQKRETGQTEEAGKYDWLFVPSAEDIEKSIEEEYGEDFDVIKIDAPKDYVKVYYMVEEGRQVSDYQWYEVHNKRENIPVICYVTWRESIWHCDYDYRFLFGVLKSFGLSGHMDGIDSYNQVYCDRGEHGRVYPVMFLEGVVPEPFFAGLMDCLEQIREDDIIFHDMDTVTINFVNPQKTDTYVLEIKRGEVIDREKLRADLTALAQQPMPEWAQ